MAEPETLKGPFPGDRKDETPEQSPPNLDSSSTDRAEAPEKPSDAVRDLEVHHGVKEKSLLRKIDAKLLPAVGVLYLLSFLDRSNGMKARVLP